MAFTRPVKGQDISAEDFGTPAYDYLALGFKSAAVIGNNGSIAANGVLATITIAAVAIARMVTLTYHCYAASLPSTGGDIQMKFDGTTQIAFRLSGASNEMITFGRTGVPLAANAAMVVTITAQVPVTVFGDPTFHVLGYSTIPAL